MSKSPFTWKPGDVVEVTNVSGENILLELDSGPLRLDAGRTTRLTAAALEQPQLVQLLRQGVIKTAKFNWRKRK
ncbi:MAG: hypothetical protein N2439_13700 [Anaerolineae bacterium]|nr:hypothetical protein [Anaerolineae bacterium]